MTTSSSERSLISRGSLFSIGPLSRALGMLILLPITTRVLATNALGLVSTAQVVTSILMAVAGLGLPSAALREYFGSTDKPGDPSLAQMLSLAAVASTVMVASITYLTGAQWIQLLGQIEFGTPMGIAVLVSIPLSLLAVSQNLLRAEDRPVPFGIAVLLATLGGHLLGLSLAHYGNGTPTEYLVGSAVGVVVGAAVASGSVGLKVRSVSKAEAMTALRFGLPTIPHALGIFLLQMGDRVVIIGIDGYSAVGRYQVAYLVGSSGIMLIIAFNAAWTPMILRMSDDAERWNSLASTTGLMHRLIGLISAGLIVVAPVLLKLAAPSSYETEGLVLVLSIVAVSALFYATFQSSSIVLLHVRQTAPLGAASLVAAAINLGLNVLLVPELGLTGAALATTASYGVWAIMIRYLASRFVSVPWNDRSLLFHLALVISALVLGSFVGTAGTSLLVRLLVGLGLGLAVIRLLSRQR